MTGLLDDGDTAGNVHQVKKRHSVQNGNKSRKNDLGNLSRIEYKGLMNENQLN